MDSLSHSRSTRLAVPLFFSTDITQTLWYLHTHSHTFALHNFPPCIFHSISNRANPVLSCLLISFALGLESDSLLGEDYSSGTPSCDETEQTAPWSSLYTSTAVGGGSFSDMSFYTSAAQENTTRSCPHCQSATAAFSIWGGKKHQKNSNKRLFKSLINSCLINRGV